MFADARLVVLCTVLAAAAAAGSPRVRGHQPVIFENDGRGTAEQRFHTGTGRPCCAGYSSTTATVRDDDATTATTSTVGVAVEDWTPREIPLSVIMELNEVSNITDLFTKFMPDVNIHEAEKLVATTGFQSRTSMNIERKAALVPKAAGCTVELQTISLKDTDDPSLYYYPPCTRVNRCGGCCAHDLLACQPTKSETLNFEVMVSQYNGAGRMEFIGRKPVSVIQHSRCKCDCIVQEKDCNELQTYYPDDCRCMCNNEEDRDKCSEEHSLKLWNPATCTCQCRETQECTSGFGFDYNTCRCEALRTKSKINSNYDFNKNAYTFGSVNTQNSPLRKNND